MRFAEGFEGPCAERECELQIHKVLLLTSNAKTVRVKLHRTGGTYWYLAPDNRGGYIREELPRQ
jgi:hypothetical protein